MIRSSSIVPALFAAAALAVVALSPVAAFAKPVTDQEKAIYALGMTIATNLSTFDMSPAEVQLFVDGMKAQMAGTAEVDLSVYGPKIMELAKVRGERYARKMKERSTAFVAEQSKKPGVKKTASGGLYFETKAGAGANPAVTDSVTVHYRGTLLDGTEFDSSYSRGEPATFPLNRVIKCWTEGVAMMKPGGKARLVCPSDIAYGEAGSPPKIPGGAALVFEVELLKVVPAGQ